ncbi:MAG: 1-(5-phosphoribosyl)-5-[(5-phosphoribosylamino)methylideneamino] imidazole-4-carboxamide isomerase [Luteitalea sp.]|nr:1-(5-phosphoribosyl)-5-[(5-phosphoribosylamino)methylideneamino] imidazole-4-carboxamide isomerase [Luteitalea sp.]
MLIPSIDLKGGQVVQLVQGRTLALASDDVFTWVDKFAHFEKVQVIDLDGALESGSNDGLIREICTKLGCRVGGGIRTIDRAQAILAAGATHIIVSSSLFKNGDIDTLFAADLARAVGANRVIAAVDSFQGKVVVRGWRESTGLTAVHAVRILEPYCAEFLYTHVDTEGLMRGTDIEAIRRVREATSRPLAAAGGITTRDEIDLLDRMGVDAVVGMAIYTGLLPLESGC